MTIPAGRQPLSSDWFANQIHDYSRVDRVELVDRSGRRYVKSGVTKVELELKDNAQTLKIFVDYEPEEEISI